MKTSCYSFWALAAPALLLAGCGGGDASTDNPPPSPATITVAADVASVAWNAASSIDVLANDKASSGALTLSAVTGAAHGTAVVTDNKIAYTPAAGFYGTEKLTYTVKAAVGGNTAQAEAVITVDAVVALDGIAAEPMQGGGTVTATVGGKQVSTTTDAIGKYSLTIRSALPADPVTLQATGPGDRARIKFTSAPGSVDTLVKRIDAQGRVNGNALHALNVSPESTVLNALTAKARIVEGSSNLLQGDVSNRIKLDDVMRRLTALRMVWSHGVALPGGIADTDALMQSDTAVEAVYTAASTMPNNLAATVRAKVEQELDAGVPFSLGGMAERTVVYSTGGFTITYGADGRGNISGQRVGERPMRWTADGSTVTITYDKAVEFLYEPYVIADDIMYGVRENTTGMVIKMALSDIAAKYGETGTVTWTDGPDAGKPAVLPPGSVTTTNAPTRLTRSFYNDSRLPIATPAVGSRIFGLVNMPAPAFDTEADVAGKGYIKWGFASADGLEFVSATQARFILSGETVNYQVQDNWLIVNHSNGNVWRFSLLTEFSDSSQLWVAEYPALKLKSPVTAYTANGARLAFTPAMATAQQLVRPPYWIGTLLADGTVRDRPGSSWEINSAGELIVTRLASGVPEPVQISRYIAIRYVGGNLVVLHDHKYTYFRATGLGMLSAPAP